MQHRRRKVKYGQSNLLLFVTVMIIVFFSFLVVGF